MHHIVVDLGFGDSGKGAITDRLAADNPDCVVIRYTGGSQAGHNVVIGDQSHVHSSFASGSLAGRRSHMSAYCPLSPGALVVEAEVLASKTGKPTIDHCSVDPLCPLITPYDKLWNQHKAKARGVQDTVGMGVGAAMYRQEHSPHKVYVSDLLHQDLYIQKLHQVKAWYKTLGWDANMPPVMSLNFESHFKILEHVKLVTTDDILGEDVEFIFEGAQGVLLDRDHGFFPYVTYGHTTMRNAVELLSRIGYPPAGVQYVSRAYQTRHGAGPMGDGKPLDLPDATNKDGEWMGPFRTAEIDFKLLRYAYAVNRSYAGPYSAFEYNVTCADRINGFKIQPFKNLFPNSMVRAWFGPERDANVVEY